MHVTQHHDIPNFCCKRQPGNGHATYHAFMFLSHSLPAFHYLYRSCLLSAKSCGLTASSKLMFFVRHRMGGSVEGWGRGGVGLEEPNPSQSDRAVACSTPASDLLSFVDLTYIAIFRYTLSSGDVETRRNHSPLVYGAYILIYFQRNST